MKRLLTALALGFCLFSTSTVKAADAATEAALAADPVAEKRLQELSAELRCLVCQNQNIADSNAELAQDLRREIRSMIKDGKSNGDIIDFMVTRYGDFVLYRPPLKASTLLLWGGPLALLLIGILALRGYLRRRSLKLDDEKPLSTDDIRRAEALLKESEPK